ncbi:MAG: fluoride efflux transporter CrcB [Pseudomonadota bacterium]
MITKLAWVALGGAVGAALRFLVGHWATQAAPGLPLGTLLVNVIGGFLMGILAVWVMERPGAWLHLAPLLMTGVLGGFTTFSAFSLDTLYLLERGRMALALGYVAASVMLSIGALALGLWLARRVLT